MEIHELHQGVPRGVPHNRFPVRGAPLQVFPDLLGRGQGVVADSHGVEEDRLLIDLVFLPAGIGLRQGPQCTGHPVYRPFAVHEVPGDVPASLHEVEVVHLLQARAEQGLDDGPAGVVDEDHDVRGLDGRVLADLYPGREAFDDGPLGCPDEAFGAFMEIVPLEVEGHHEALARAPPGGDPVNEDEARPLRSERAVVEILPHAGIDLSRGLFVVALLEVRLGEDDMKGGRVLPHEVPDPFPVFGLRGVLVAGDHGPSREVDALSRQQDLRCQKSNVIEQHGMPPSGFSYERSTLL